MANFSQQGDLLGQARIQFARRGPSAAWEQVPFGTSSRFFWVWFKPPAVPQGLFIRLPQETHCAPIPSADSASDKLTMRTLLQAAGIDPKMVSLWYLYGSPCESRNGTSPSFDQPIEEPPFGADPNIVVLLDGPVVDVPTTPCLPAGISIAPDLIKVFDEMEADWYASQLLEKQLLLARKDLTSALGRLSALDRDLSPEERLHGERQDKSDWQEVRRTLKDAAGKLFRYIKEHDVGETSAAGKKGWFADIYKQVVVPRRAVEGLLQLHREFESYRKRLQILLQNMSLANTTAAQEAERRAHQILNRLGTRARSAQSKTKGWTAHRWLTHKQRDSI